MLDHARSFNVQPRPAEDFQVIQGKGATAVIGGQSVWIGSHRLLEERGQETPEVHARLEALEAQGASVVVVGNDRHVCGFLAVADRVWRAVGSHPFDVNDERHRVTISLGVALFPSRDVRSKDQLLLAADRALYQAKADGRDRICVFQHQGYIYRPDLPSDPT